MNRPSEIGPTRPQGGVINVTGRTHTKNGVDLMDVVTACWSAARTMYPMTTPATMSVVFRTASRTRNLGHASPSWAKPFRNANAITIQLGHRMMLADDQRALMVAVEVIAHEVAHLIAPSVKVWKDACWGEYVSRPNYHGRFFRQCVANILGEITTASPEHIMALTKHHRRIYAWCEAVRQHLRLGKTLTLGPKASVLPTPAPVQKRRTAPLIRFASPHAGHRVEYRGAKALVTKNGRVRFSGFMEILFQEGASITDSGEDCIDATLRRVFGDVIYEAMSDRQRDVFSTQLAAGVDQRGWRVERHRVD